MIIRISVMTPSIFDRAYSLLSILILLLIGVMYVQKDEGSSIFEGFPFEELVGGGVDHLEVAVVEGGYFVYFLYAEGSAVGGLAQGNHLSVAAAAVAPTERSFHYEAVPASFLLESVVNQQQFLFEIFLHISKIVVDQMGITLFLSSGNLFGEQID